MPHHDMPADEKAKHGEASVGKLVAVGLLSSAIGAATAMLLSPWRGAEARLRIKEKARNIGNALKEKAPKITSTARHTSTDD